MVPAVKRGTPVPDIEKEKAMNDGIRVGTMLMQDGTEMPPTLVLTTNRCLANWSYIIGVNSAQLAAEIEKAGWTFFYMAGEIRTSSFGFNDQSGAARALAGLINAVKLQSCNCLEITEVQQRSFLGAPYTSLVAHARHIQKSRSFYDLSNLPARIPVRSREWLYDRPAAMVQSKPLLGGEPAEQHNQDRATGAEAMFSVSVSAPGPVDRIQPADVGNEPRFHAGDKIIVAEGPHKDVLGTFLGLEDEVQWAAIKEADGGVSSHPVAWMRSHPGLLSYTSLTGRGKT